MLAFTMIPATIFILTILIYPILTKTTIEKADVETEVPDPKFIVNGTEAEKHEFKFMVALTRNKTQFCGGSLISANHILTAAHCVQWIKDKKKMNTLQAHIGDHNIKSEEDGPHQIRNISKVVTHAQFQLSTMEPDVAILFLDEPVEFDDSVQSVLLPNAAKDLDLKIVGYDYDYAYYDHDDHDDIGLNVGEKAIAIGWGRLASGGEAPEVLHKVEVDVLSNKDCKESYSDGKIPIAENMLCAASPYKDACQGDSGGPLVIRNGGDFVQIGITSWGEGCAQLTHPGVYTRVSHMVKWIRGATGHY